MINNIIKRVLENKFTLIAEIGVNYYDIAKKFSITNVEAAKLMVKKAKEAGIHAVKFQTYKASSLASKNSPSYWDNTEETTNSQYELFSKYDSFGYKEYKELSDYCEEIGIEFLSTPFDTESADYLFDLMNVYKISSSDLSNIPFIKYQAKKGKPIIISSGASNLDEIEKAISAIKEESQSEIILMHCVLEYPTPYSHANLNRIISLKKHFPDLIIGYSDHTKPDKDMQVLKTAYNLGAVAIEKHFTLDKTLPGNDHYHAMDENDSKKIIDDMKFIDEIRGSYSIKCLDTEISARKNARRSIVARCKISASEVITKDMLTFKRPGTGISPSEIDKVLGKKAKKIINSDDILKFEDIE